MNERQDRMKKKVDVDEANISKVASYIIPSGRVELGFDEASGDSLITYFYLQYYVYTAF